MYELNRKNLEVARLVPRYTGESRLQYLHVSSKGTTAVSPELVARVSLPEGREDVKQTVIYPIANVDAHFDGGTDAVTLTGEMPAVTGPKTLVPQIDKCFPDAQATTATFTCNAELLKKILEVATKVIDDPMKTIRLRIIDNGKALRIDSYAEPGQQSLCAVMKPIDYDGNYIAGELPSGVKKIEHKPQQVGKLKMSEGRRFRGEGE